MNAKSNSNTQRRQATKSNPNTKGRNSKDSHATQKTTVQSGAMRGTKGSKDFNTIKSNDVSWYNKVEPLFSDAVRVPFNRVAGDQINFNYADFSNISKFSPSVNGSIPGIMSFEFFPTIGEAASSDDPVNRAFTSMYGDIYSRTTGAMQFQQADLAMWVMGMDSIISLIGSCKRLLGIANLYVSLNFNYPRALYAALTDDANVTNAEWTTFIANQDNYRRRLNNAIVSFNAMNVPDFIDVFKRHYTLSSNIWADSDAVQAQLYVFNLGLVYQYVDTAIPAMLQAVSMRSKLTMDGMLTMLETLLEAWRNSSDLGLIKGSVERAYAASNFVKLDFVEVDSVTIPVFDRIMLYQINNATLANPFPQLDVDYSLWNITQNPELNLLWSSPQFRANSLTNTTNYFAAAGTAYTSLFHPRVLQLLNSYDGDTSPEFIMEATRLMCTAIGAPTAQGFLTTLRDMGTEAINRVTIWYRSNASELPTTVVFDPIEVLDPSAFALGISEMAMNIAAEHNLIDKFDMAPKFGHIFTDPTSTVATPRITFSGFTGDVNVYTTIDADARAGLQMAAMQSLYQVNNGPIIK